jgi:hypothetical protein
MLLNKKLFVAAGALAAVTWCATPLYAQQRGHSGSQGRGQSQSQQGQQGQQGQSRSGGERRAVPTPQTRPEAQRPAPPQAQRSQQASPQQAQRPQQQVAPQRFGGVQPRQAPPAQMQRPAPSQAFRSQQSAPQQAPAQRFGNVAQPRPSAPVQAYRGAVPANRNVAPTYRGAAVPSSAHYAYRGAAQGYYSPHYYSQPYYAVHPYVARRAVFVQPYYAFRPYFSLSFGFHVGYGVAYPFSYWDPYAFYNYHLGIQPGYNYQTYYNRVGGVSFEIDPYDAEVYVDGDFVGYASDFGPEQMPLTLQAGRHHVDLSAAGYQDVSFDITVVSGQVIPYQGSLPFGQ